MITPLDIQNKEFPRAVRGYKEDEVDGFLDLLTLDFEKLIDENKNLKESVKKLTSDLARYQNSEGAVLNTLEAAKALMADISASAEKRAEILLKNAELDAQIIQKEARDSVERLTEEANAMKSRLKLFKTKYKSFLEEEQRSLESLSIELFLNLDSDESKLMSETRVISEKIEMPSQRSLSTRENLSQTRQNLIIGEQA